MNENENPRTHQFTTGAMSYKTEAAHHISEFIQVICKQAKYFPERPWKYHRTAGSQWAVFQEKFEECEVLHSNRIDTFCVCFLCFIIIIAAYGNGFRQFYSPWLLPCPTMKKIAVSSFDL